MNFIRTSSTCNYDVTLSTEHTNITQKLPEYFPSLLTQYRDENYCEKYTNSNPISRDH